ELRYMMDPDDDNVNWTPGTSNAALSARLVIERVPSSTRKVVVGQVHGFQSNAFIKLRYLYDSATHTGSIAGLALGQPLTYSIAFSNREITIKINGHVLSSFHVQPGWLHEPMYFK